MDADGHILVDYLRLVVDEDDDQAWLRPHLDHVQQQRERALRGSLRQLCSSLKS